MNKYILGAIVLSAMITFLLRALPFLLFKEKELPEWLKKIEKKLPMTIMAVLIVYCLKAVSYTHLYRKKPCRA